ncbi:MAG: hypothetical protein IT372_35910 [Polyangiaceae bacterium]|nr:hypothetical protein [Polyangiaceae bacterium]
MSRRLPRPPEIARLAAVLVAFVAAPVVGDIGSCGQEAAELDAYKFFYVKGAIDCERCGECGLSTRACTDACAPQPKVTAFDEGCYPLVHDGEVCLHALQRASCDEYASYMSDEAPTTPTECNFCPPDERPGAGGSP